MSARCTTALPTLGTQIIGLANSDFAPCLASSLFLFSLLLFVAFSVIALFLESLKIFLLSESFRPAMLFKQALNLLVIVWLVSSMLCQRKSYLLLHPSPDMIVSRDTISSHFLSLVRERWLRSRFRCRARRSTPEYREALQLPAMADLLAHHYSQWTIP